MAQETHLWIRAEVKPNEHRTPITPDICAKLLEAGFKITVEKSTDRCVPDEEYAAVGCEIVEAGTWRSAPKETFIFGLKELPENDTSPLGHRHIFFAHCFKNQTGWAELLKRFHAGNGQILDLEFLNDEKGRRVAAFGYMAGYAGSALGLQLWAHKIINPGKPYANVQPYPNAPALQAAIRAELAQVTAQGRALPRILVIGALGRCGAGAVDFATHAGIPAENIIKWDMAETARGGPFPELLEVDIVVNCIYLTTKIPPFISTTMLETQENRVLSVVVDVSCDFTSANNPIPIYSQGTTFIEPAVTLDLPKEPVVDVIAIDHLPTLLPLESSQRFGADLLPTLMQLPNIDTARVWQDAIKLYNEKLALALQQ